MAFYNKTDDLSRDPTLPRDPTAIEESARGGIGILSTVIVLLIIAGVVGLYFTYADSDSTPRAVNAPSTTQLSPAPAPTPSPQTTP